jgi:hypothetical protein
LQENESTNYVIGVMSDTLDYDELPNLWHLNSTMIILPIWFPT